MKVPLEWLKDYVPLRLSAEVLAERLTMVGLEVVGIEAAAGGPVLDLEVTPNRADCLSIIGVAREVALLTNQRLKLPSAQGDGGKPGARRPEAKPKLVIRIEDRQGCVRYVGRLMDEVRVAPSPAWLQQRLLACGARPINNVVDITNYVLFEYGQPLHAFDFDRLAQGTVLVRRARTGEALAMLDGVRRTLSAEMLVIADAAQPVAVAGLMGGSGSEVAPQTRTVLLESAWFDPVTVRRTARKLGVASESSYRFERGVDPAGVETASVRAASLIEELAGGRETALVDAGTKPLKRTGIVLDAGRAGRWLGTPLSPTAARATLAKLGCHVASSGSGGSLHVSVPSFRRDLVQEVDLYEELARALGYEHLPSTIPLVPMAAPPSDDAVRYQRTQSLRCLCAGLGLTEALTWSLISEAELTRCGFQASDAVRLANPLSQEHAWLRPSLLIGLLQAVRRNLTQGAAGVRFFELGRVFRPQSGEQPVLGIVLSGIWGRDWRTREPGDFFRLKGLLQSLTARLCRGTLALQPSRPPWAQAPRGLDVQLNGRSIGAAGQVAPAIAEAFDVERDVWFAEISVEALLEARRTAAAIQPPPAFPPVKRDLSIMVDDAVAFASLDAAVRETAGAWAGRIELIDRFTGKPVPAGKHSLTFSIEYRDPSRTLTAAEVDEVHRRIGDVLGQRFGAQLRA